MEKTQPETTAVYADIHESNIVFENQNGKPGNKPDTKNPDKSSRHSYQQEILPPFYMQPEKGLIQYL